MCPCLMARSLTLDKKIAPVALRAAITRNGGEVGTPWKAWVRDKTSDGISIDELELRFETKELARTLQLAQQQLEEIRARSKQKKSELDDLKFEKRRLQDALAETGREITSLQNALNRVGAPPRK
jgi:hypothetical protein